MLWKFVWMLYYTQNKQNMYGTSRCGGCRSHYSTRNRRTFPGNILSVFVSYMMQCNDVRKDCDILYTIYYIRRKDGKEGWLSIVEKERKKEIVQPVNQLPDEWEPYYTIAMCCAELCCTVSWCAVLLSGGALYCTALCRVEWCDAVLMFSNRLSD